MVNAAGDDCPDWVPGELWVSGRGIARGYRGRPDLTAQKFVEYDGRTWYRTGDLVRYWPDGTCEFVGRADHRVKVSGYRIELGDVEAALRRVTGVVGAVAAVVPTGPDSAVLAAMVRVDDDRCTAAQIRAGLADFVPAHMIPQQVTLVDRIPFTVGGKIDRRAVTADLTAAVAAGGAPGYPGPGPTPVEKALAAIVGELLGVPDVGVDDDFFALGGDSVLATAAVARIRTWLDVPDAAVADLFATRTVAALAGRLADREPDPGRLDQVAEVYLDIAGMDSAAVLSEIGAQ
ncbi:Phenyloxazoline synthase MbtB [Mycobacterium talmoniae]|uniref:Phenyloxazoline synthase MbtB n=1 Tax=Mycobacterium talmoniae TaxID=1858794 RepID=A0A2S8BC04_9MYCO|nr:Phenyloxazoline synthase MbtB [Mycobacterium talmoniae]